MITAQQISLVGAPVDLGAGRRGVDLGPAALRHAGINERLSQLGFQVFDEGNVDLVETNPILDNNNVTAKVAVELICSVLGETIF